MLNQSDVDAYHRDGFLCGIRVMTDPEVQHYQDEFDELEAREGREKAYNGFIDRHFDQRFLWDVATHPKMLDCATDLLGPDLLLLSTHCFCKYGPEEKFVAWHQDLRYWGLEPPVEVSAWYAVDDSDRENGCMRVIPRLHRDSLVEHGKSSQPGNLLSINQEVAVSAEEEQAAVDCVLKAGEISLHDGMLLHGSLPNRSTRRRCGVAVRYLPARVRPHQEGPHGTRWKWRPILVRGTADGCGFDLEPPPFPLT